MTHTRLTERIATGNPNQAIGLIKQYGLTTPSINNTSRIAHTLDFMLKEYGEPVWDSLINIHPDKDLFDNYKKEVVSSFERENKSSCCGSYFNGNNKSERANCDCNCCRGNYSSSGFNGNKNTQMFSNYYGEEKSQPLFKNGMKDAYPIIIIGGAGLLGLWALLKSIK
jgi:hypothetical protein